MSTTPETHGALGELRNRLAELADLDAIGMLLEWDQLVMMPTDGGEARAHHQRPKLKGAAKKLTRLVKAWKYYNSVPMFSFYLEMRAAQYMAGETSFIPVWDICRLLEHLNRIGIGPMNDPRQVAGRFYACSTEAKGKEAISKVSTAAIRARKAAVAHKEGNSEAAFHYLNLLFGGRFPAR